MNGRGWMWMGVEEYESAPQAKAGTAMMKQDSMAITARSCSTVCRSGRLAGMGCSINNDEVADAAT